MFARLTPFQEDECPWLEQLETPKPLVNADAGASLPDGQRENLAEVPLPASISFRKTGEAIGGSVARLNPKLRESHNLTP